MSCVSHAVALNRQSAAGLELRGRQGAVCVLQGQPPAPEHRACAVLTKMGRCPGMNRVQAEVALWGGPRSTSRNVCAQETLFVIWLPFQVASSKILDY